MPIHEKSLIRPENLVEHEELVIDGIDVEGRVRLVEQYQLRALGQQLHHLRAFDLAAGEAVVHRPLGEGGIHLEELHLLEEEILEVEQVDLLLAAVGLDRRPEEECLDLLSVHDVGVVVRGGLAKGLLASKPATASVR